MVQLRRLTGFGFLSGLGLLALTFNACSDSSEDGNNFTPDASSQGGASSGGVINVGGDPDGSGGSSRGGTRNTGGANRGGTNSAGGTGGNGGSGSCLAVGRSCDSPSDCCSASCDPDLSVCAVPVGTCKAAGDSCAAQTECCTGVCNDGECGATICISDNEACSTDGECCGGRCEGAGGNGGTCRPLNTGCRTAGNTCTNNSNCCSGLCDNGRCSGRPSFCVQTGDACAADADCCGGICTMASGVALGTCTVPEAPGTTGCLLAGQLCGGVLSGEGGADNGGIPVCGGECCSRACAPYRATGVMICQPPSGCRPTGEICINDSDCCNGPGLPGNESVTCVKQEGAPVGRCDNGTACRGAGAICKLATTSCNAENNCCAGNVNQDPTVCQQDNLGIPRCTGAGDCTQGGSREGDACASSADCCGLPCLPNVNGGPDDPPFICGPSCVESGGVCTTDADCCAGLPCNLMPGSTHGTCGSDDPPDGGAGGMGTGGSGGTGGGPDCAFVGQSCTDSSDCCNNLPCTQGTCRPNIF